MAENLTLRSTNQALKAGILTSAPSASGEEVMTISGTVQKTVGLLLIVIVTASWTWSLGASDSTAALVFVSGLAGFVVAMATVLKPTCARFTAPLYAVLEGFVLGGIALEFELSYPGIAGNAVFLTFGTLGAFLLAYHSRLIQPTENLKLGVTAATGGIAILYLLSLVTGWFGITLPLIHTSGTFGILFSAFVVGVAAYNLVLDFDFIEEGEKRRAPKYLEWYGAFGLLVTLVWLYLEVLRLLAKLQSDE